MRMQTYGRCRHLSHADAVACSLCASNPAANPPEPPSPPAAPPAPPDEAVPAPLGERARSIVAIAATLLGASLPAILFVDREHLSRSTAVILATVAVYFTVARALAGWIGRNLVLRWLGFCLANFVMLLFVMPILNGILYPQPAPQDGIAGWMVFTALMVLFIPYAVIAVLALPVLTRLLRRCRTDAV